MIKLMVIAATKRQFIFGISFCVLFAVGLYGILPSLGMFDESIVALRQAKLPYVALAVAFTLAGTACAAGIYRLLSDKRLPYGKTLAVQVSGLFINRILPAGIGGLGLNYLFLRAHKHTATQASLLVAINNSLGLVGHLILATILLGIYMAGGNSFSLSLNGYWEWLIGAGVVLVMIFTVLLRAPRYKKFRARAARQIGQLFKYYSQHPMRVFLALSLSCLLTFCNLACLWLCCSALGVELSLPAVFVVFTFGVAAATATPTPGGLGGAELGLIAALAAQNVELLTAVSAILLFRLASYWVGLPIGLAAFGLVQSRHLLRR